VVRSTAVRIVRLMLFAAFMTACADTVGFRFPIEQADIANGKQAFIDHRCHQCHGVAGVKLPTLAGEAPVRLMLGGETTAAKSYAGLVESIINPNHVISERYREQLRLDAEVPLESPMPMVPIDNMTIRQLLDIVAFLDSRYASTDDYDAGP